MLSVEALGQVPDSIDVCVLLRSPGKYHGKLVTVRGYVEASYHWTLLTGDDCKGVVALADSAFLKDDPLYAKYHKGVFAARSKELQSRMEVVVRGRFKSALRKDGLVGSQLVIYRILQIKR